MRCAWLISVCLGCALSGCYLSHERACLDGPPTTTDVGLRPIVDDVVPAGARPSDAPSARSWIASPVATAEPCCDVGEPVALGDALHPVSAPVIAWNGTSFGAVWAVEPAPGVMFCPRAIYQQLSVDADPVSPERVLPGLRTPAAIAWAEDRYLLAASAGGPANYLVLLDRTGTITELSMPTDLVTAVARFPAARAWVTASHTYALDEWSPATLTLLDDDLEVTREITLDPVSSASALRLAVLASRLVVQGDRRRGTELDVFDGAALSLVGRVSAGAAGSWLVATRDGAMTAGIAGMVVSSLWSDPFAMSEAGVRGVASPEGERRLYVDGAAASDDRGATTAVCWIETAPRSDPDADDVLRFLLMDSVGVAIGAPIELELPSGTPEPRTCAVASNGADRYLLMFSVEAERGPRMFAVSIGVRR